MNLLLTHLKSLAMRGSLLAIMVLAGVSFANAASKTWTGTTSTNWATGTNWSGGSAPVAGDTANIPGSLTNYPVISTSVNITAININTAGSGATLTVTSGGALTALGLLKVNAGGSFILSGGTASVAGLTSSAAVNISSGTLTSTANLILNSGAVLTQTGGTVHLAVNTSTNPTVNIQIGSGATVNQSAGTLYTRDYAAGTDTFNQTGATALFKIYRDWKPGAGSVFNSTAGTVEFAGSGNSPDFANGSRQFSNVTVDAGVDPLFPLLPSSTLPISGNFTNNSTSLTMTSNVTFTFNGSGNQTIYSAVVPNNATFGHLTIANTGSTVSLTSSIVVVGNLSINSGTYNLGAFTTNGSSLGPLTIANNATLKIGGTNGFPGNYTTTTLAVASTVEYSGTNQTVANQTYGNLNLSSSSGAAVKTFPGTALTVNGSLISSVGTGTSVSFTAAANIAVSGSVNLGASTTFNGGSFSHTVAGNWTNSGTFTGSTSTVTFTGAGAAVSGAGTHNFNNLTVSGAAVTFSNASIAVAGNLATTGAGSFTQASGGTITMSGTSKTISGTGISIDNLTVTGSVTTASTLTLTGNLSVAGSFTASTGTITMSGAAKTISGAGTKSFNQLLVSGSLTTDGSFSIAAGLTVSGSLSASAGTATFTGSSTLSGTANLYNVTLNGTSLQLSTGSTLGIANALTITAGTLNVTSSTPNTVSFNGTGAQNVNGITFNNLTLASGNTKTAAAAVTVNGVLTIANGTTFAAGTYTHSIYGNWINSGTFSTSTGTIQFLGDQAAEIRGATTFNVLTVNKAADATSITLVNDVSVATLNMTLGRVYTGGNTITITTTRTGGGEIYGNIQRTHTFATGVAYAFEGPNNTVTFSSISGVSTITVSVVDGTVSDFPYTSSVNEQYTISIPAGTYNATLRLDYDDDELNGNDESTMTLWKYNGSAWVDSGKTANDTTGNYVEVSALTSITTRWTFANPGSTNVVQWNGSTSTDWNAAANWTVVSGSPSRPPTANDIAYLGTATFTNNPTISNAVTVKQVHFGSAQAVTLTMASGGSLTSSNVDGEWSSSATHNINVNNQTITVNGGLTLSDGVTGHAINVNVGTGTVNVNGSLTQSGGANVVFTGAGNLNIEGDYAYTDGTFTPGSSTVTYNGGSNQNVAAVTYHNLTINSGAAATINTTTVVDGDLTVTGGELENYSTTTINGNVVISSGATLHNHLYFHVKGDWTNNGTFVATETASMYFDGNGTQYISATTFNNLNINKPVGASAVLTGNCVVNSNLNVTSGTFDLEEFSCNRSIQGGTMTVGSAGTLMIDLNNLPANFSTTSFANASTVILDGTSSQSLSGGSFGNLIFRNGGLKTLTGPLTLNGDLTIENGATFDGGSQTVTLNGNWINNGTFTPSTSSLEFVGAGKTVSGNTTFNAVTVSGNYSVSGSNITYDGPLTVTSTGTYSLGSGTAIFNGDLINSGSLTSTGVATLTGTRLQTLTFVNAFTAQSTGTVNFNGTVSPVLNFTITPTYGDLNINNTGGINCDQGWVVYGTMTVGTGASFNGGDSTHNFYGNIVNNGAITSSGIMNFAPTAAATVNMGSNFSSTGTVNFGGTGALTLAGSPSSFFNVTVSNSNAAGITPANDWIITNDLSLDSGATLNAGSRTFSLGGSLSNSGTINSGSSTFIFNGSGAQDVYSNSAFKNLTINKSAAGVTLSSDITVSGVLNFVSGKIQTDSNHLVQTASASITGAGQSSGWINGNLQKHISTGASSTLFEVGGPNNYSPLTVAFSGVSTAGELIASGISGDHASISSSTIDAARSINRTWTLTNSGVVFGTYDATLNFVAGDVDAGVNTNAVKVGIYSGGSWTYATVGTKTSTSTQATGLTAFGDFQIGATNAIPSVALNLSVSPNGTVAPRTDLVYTINFTNSGTGSASAFVITDPIPANTDFKIGSATTSLGTTGLTPTISYSNDGGTTWTYTPASAGGGAPAGYDRNVTNVRWSFGSTLSQTAPNNTGSVNITARIR